MTLLMYRINDETGEREEIQPTVPNIDRETGEQVYPTYSRPSFSVPKALKLSTKENTDHKKRHECCLDGSFSLVDKKDYIKLKEEIILGHNKTSPILFLIPTLLFFFKLTIMILLSAEAILHIYAHKKNAKNTNPQIYYRSPLHLVTSEFCAICRAEAEAQKVGKIQDERLTRRNRFRLKFTLRNFV